MNILYNYLQTQNDLYYVQKNGWYFSANIQFIGIYEKCLEYLHMTNQEYQKQVKEKSTIDGFWNYEIRPIPILIEQLIKREKEYYNATEEEREKYFQSGYKIGLVKAKEDFKENYKKEVQNIQNLLLKLIEEK